MNMDKEYLQSCHNMALLMESCYDENNPDDGKTFKQRLEEKMKDLQGMDLQVIRMVNV